MTVACDADLTRDAFLGGRVHAWQPRSGFRAGVDAVLLAASVPARAGERVLELGCGAAVASLCLEARIGGVLVHGVEKQSEYADLARRNAAESDSNLTVVEADLRAMPGDVRQISFDHVLMNPPYFIRDHGSGSRDPGRDLARGGETALVDWIDVATRRLCPGGVLSLIQRADRMPDVLSAMDDRLGAVEILPILPRVGRAAGLFLMRARKGRRDPFQLRSPLVMHTALRHSDTDDGYSEGIEAVLRNGQRLAGFAE